MTIKKNSQAVKFFLDVFCECEYVSEAIKTQLTMLSEMIDGTKVTLENLKDHKKRIESETSMLIHKALSGLQPATRSLPPLTLQFTSANTTAARYNS